MRPSLRWRVAITCARTGPLRLAMIWNHIPLLIIVNKWLVLAKVEETLIAAKALLPEVVSLLC